MKRRTFAKILLLGVILVMCAVVMCACNDNEIFDNIYHATLYDNKKDWINMEYLESQLEYDADDENKTMPKSKTFIISTQDKFDKMFESFQADIDLNNQMILLYVYNSINIHERRLQNIKLQDEKLTILFDTAPCKYSGELCATSPQARIIFIVMDKLEIEKVEFIKI